MFLRFIVTSLILIFGAFIVAPYASAFEAPEEEQSLTRESILESKNKNLGFIGGQRLNVRIESLINRLGELETRVFWQEPHLGLELLKTEQLILVGRDLDGDELVDTWFFQDEVGHVHFIHQKQNNSDDLDAIRRTLGQFFQSEGRWLVSIALKNTLKAVTFSVENEYSFMQYYETRQIDLIDLSLRLEMIERKNPKDSNLPSYKEMYASSVIQLVKEYKSYIGSGRLKNVGADVALALAGGVAIKGASKLGSMVLKNPSVKQALARLEKMGEEHLNRLEATVQKVGGLTKKRNDSAKKVAPGIAERLTMLPASQRAAGLISHLSFEAKLSKVLMDGVKGGAKGIASVLAKYGGYAATSTSVQLVAESLARGYMTLEPAVLINKPIKTSEEFFKNVVSDKDLLENLGYMTAETLIVSGADDALKKRGLSLKKRLVICAGISAIDSMGMGFLVKGDSDPTKMVEDVAWESVIGNSQVMVLDRTALNYFQQLSEKLSKGYVKYLGTVFVVADQFAGYTLYNHYPEFVEKKVLPKLKAIPIFSQMEE